MEQGSPRVTIADIEETLCQVGEVKAARIVASPTGQIQEIHVLALPTKSPKQLVRDIESTIMATFGIPIDHKKISIAQIGQEEISKESAAENTPARARIQGINTDVKGVQAQASVSLDMEGDTYVGTATGPASQSGRMRLVAQATLDAVEQYSHSAYSFALEDVSIVQLGHERVAVACVVLVTALGEQPFSGSALVRQSEKDSIVRATLDAINRRVGFLTT